MAAPVSLTEQFDTLYSTTWQLMREEVVDNIFKATPLYYWLSSKQRIRRETGGRWIGVQLMYAKNTTVATLGPGGVVDITPQDPMTTAKYDWRWLAGSVVRLFAEDHMNAGQKQIMNLVQAKLKNLELSLIDKLELMAFGDGTGNGGLDFDGIANLVGTTAGLTVGGINSTTQTWWDNQRRTYVPGNGIRAEMTTMYNNVSVGNDHPTLLLTTQGIFEMYETSLTNILRVDSNKMGDAGFEALGFKGAAITFAPSGVATNVYFLNERYLEMVVESGADFVMTDWKPIPNQLDRVAQVVTQGDIVTSNRRMQGVLTGVA
jgi:hypothetical protein